MLRFLGDDFEKSLKTAKGPIKPLEEGKPVPVEYQLELTTDTEKAEWEGAKKRIEARRKRREEGY